MVVYPEGCCAFAEGQQRERLVPKKRPSKNEMAAEKSKDSSGDAEGQPGVTSDVDREGTGAGTAAVEKGNNEKRSDDATREESKQKEGQQVKDKEKEDEEEEEELVIEQPLLTIKEVFVYQVPPLRASSGHRAEEWGLANPVFTGECWQACGEELIFSVSIMVTPWLFLSKNQIGCFFLHDMPVG